MAELRELRVPLSVRRVEVLSVKVPFITEYRTAYGTIAGRRSLLVRLEDSDGVVGWGEGPGAEQPIISSDTHDSGWYALTRVLVPRVAGRDFSGPGEFAAAWADIIGYHGAKHALECAAWSVVSQKLGQPLSKIWGGVREAIPVGETFTIKDSLSELFDEIERKLAENYRRIKLKIEPGWDSDVTSAVAARFPGVPLSVDGNCSYRWPDAGPWAELDTLGLLMIEQPFGREALCDLASLQRELNTPLCLDESASSLAITQAALGLKAGRVVNIKPARVGGIFAAMDIHDLCAANDVPVWCGGMLETGIGRAFNLAMASLPHFSFPADMSPAKDFYAEDLVEPTFDIEPDGTIAVPQGLGCGFNVSAERIAKYTVAKWTAGELASRGDRGTIRFGGFS